MGAKRKGGGYRPPPKYLPSRKEIREQCLRIQEGWSDKERAKRSCVKRIPWELPVVSPVLDPAASPQERAAFENFVRGY